MNETSSNETFFIDLVAIFTQVGVPLREVSHPVIKFFLEKYTENLFMTRAHFEKTMLGESMTQYYLKLKK